MHSPCLALLLSLVGACTLPGIPLTLSVTLPPHPDLCITYAAHAPVCGSHLIDLVSGQVDATHAWVGGTA